MSMRVAFVSSYNARDIRYWSGTPYYMSQTLANIGVDVSWIGPLQKQANLTIVARWLYHRYVTHLNYLSDREPFLTTGYARQIERRLVRLNPDVVLSPSTIPIARLNTNVPIVLWTDATFDAMVNYYPEWTGLPLSTLHNGHKTEQEALSRCALAVYSSEWAAETATKYYDIEKSKLRVIPFGANIDCTRTTADVVTLIQNRSRECCRLLFVGQQWQRKGGDLAVAVAEELNRRGTRAELTIVGCVPPLPMPDCVSVKGFISKSTAEGRKALDDLFATSHFCLVPSRAECYGVAVAEAASFGVPTVSTGVGGLASAMTEQNGKVCSLEDFVGCAVDYIVSVFSENPLYESLAVSSFNTYETRLNWHIAVARMLDLLTEASQ